MKHPLHVTKTELGRMERRAAEKLVDGFSTIDTEVFGRVNDADEALALPMWGTLFQVTVSCDRRVIEGLCRSLFPSEDFEALQEFAKDHGLDFDASRYCEDATDDDPDAEAAAEDLLEAWCESGDDLYSLHVSGWQEVDDTGILAFFTDDGGLYLGINGAGYNFFDDHWIPLYRHLGYTWHFQELRTERICDLAREIAHGRLDPTEGAARLKTLFNADPTTDFVIVDSEAVATPS